MRRRLFRRRLFWIGVFLALTLIWLTLQVLRVAEAVVSAARRPARNARPDPLRVPGPRPRELLRQVVECPS